MALHSDPFEDVLPRGDAAGSKERANGHGAGGSSARSEAGRRKKQEDAGPKQPWRSVFRPVAEIIAEGDEDVKYHVQDLVPQGWLGMVVADTKVGKTLLMLQLARAMGLGTDFLGKKTTPGRVILVLVDDPKVLSKKRLREGLADVPNVRAYIDRWTPQTLLALEEAVAEAKPDLVVIDTLVKVSPRSAGAENDAPLMDGLLERLTALTSNEKTTVILLHHENRGGGVRGSSAIEGAAPFVMKLKSDGADGAKGRTVTLTMDWKLAPIEPLVLTHEESGFVVQGTVGEARRAERRADLENRILVAVKDGYDRQTTICEALKSDRNETLHALNALVEKELLTRSGTGMKGSPFTYALRTP
jgi:archaellum biogenesis ATPase FlaH